MNNLVAKASLIIDAPVADVWETLLDPGQIKQYMFGTTVRSDWIVGGPITWSGEWEGKAYQDHGRILELDEGYRLVYTHFSPLSGKPDKPENYHQITIELDRDGTRTAITLSQDNNRTEKEREHAAKNWDTVLHNLRRLLEA